MSPRATRGGPWFEIAVIELAPAMENATKRHGNWRARVALTGKKGGVFILATALALGILEVAFRLAGYRPLYDIYSKPEIFWQRDPLLGWSHEPNSSAVFVGPRPFPVEFRGNVRINSIGL